MHFIKELHRRNPVMAWYSLLNFIAAIVCVVLISNTSATVNGINAYIKPCKFFISIAIFCVTMGWIMHYLDRPSKVRAYNRMAVIVFFYESFVITWQAANGRLSHFNSSSFFYLALYQVMGIAIVLLTLWTGYIGLLFIRKKNWNLPMSYVWGIRLGIAFFVLFALEGGIMGALFRHTIGGDDGGHGLPLVNWNRAHGDLRVAHFLGMHTLQLFPLFGYYVTSSVKPVILFAIIYVLIVVSVLVQALMGLPLF
ncbi:MAG: hypothetical protein EOO00_03870 [Chitinophagaceae bacterium]|nr:MAG: hypothetical protein EOO00_03870 [Chitinophagaceae bacterium]